MLQRMKMDSDTKKATARAGTGATETRLSAMFKSTAMLKGVDMTSLKSELLGMKFPESEQTKFGFQTSDRSYKGGPGGGNSLKPQHPAVMVPEAAGLPVDEQYTYLTMMKRYVVYGPTLGLQGQGGGGSMMLPPGVGAGGGGGGPGEAEARGASPALSATPSRNSAHA